MKEISVEALKARLDSGETVYILDVREPFEYEEFNIGAINMPLGTLPIRIEELDSKKNEEIILHCRSGARSTTAAEFLISKGFTDIINLTGGMLAWQKMK